MSSVHSSSVFHLVAEWTRREQALAGRAKNGPGSEVIAGNLRELIKSGKLAPGDQIPSYDQLREQYGASAPVVRYAVKTLETERLVETRPGTGKFVTDPDQWQVNEVAEIMRRLTTLQNELRALREQADHTDRRLDRIEQRRGRSGARD
jgi:DNA-binding FadR family transcriptional regulator